MSICASTRQWIKSTIQLPHSSTSNMKIGVMLLLFGLFDFSSQQPTRGWDYTQKFSPIWKKVKQQPLDQI